MDLERLESLFAAKVRSCRRPHLAHARGPSIFFRHPPRIQRAPTGDAASMSHGRQGSGLQATSRTLSGVRYCGLCPRVKRALSTRDLDGTPAASTATTSPTAQIRIINLKRPRPARRVPQRSSSPSRYLAQSMFAEGPIQCTQVWPPSPRPTCAPLFVRPSPEAPKSGLGLYRSHAQDRGLRGPAASSSSISSIDVIVKDGPQLGFMGLTNVVDELGRLLDCEPAARRDDITLMSGR